MNEIADKKRVKLAVMGFGVVGSGTVELFYKNLGKLEKNAEVPLEMAYILDLRDFPESPYKNLFVKTLEPILADPEVSVVVECLGGLNPTYDFVKRCLEAGKSVVSSNKELIAEKGAELLALAEKNGASLLFEGSVAGAIPILRPLRQCLIANELAEVVGILNGTTNFILTKMIKEAMTFDEALALAQSLGYAERDPSADIDGHDACRKICILASLAFGKHVYPAQVHTEGVRAITLEDIAYADNWGGEVKLLGRVQRLENGKLMMLVAPEFVSRASQLASVDDVFNAVMVKGDAVDKVMFFGRGAGKFPTASAMLADVVEAIRAKTHGVIPPCQWADSVGEDLIVPCEEMVLARYFRVLMKDTAAGKTLIEKLFGEVQYLSREGAPAGELAFLTEQQAEGKTALMMEDLKANGVEILSSLRVLDCTWNALV